MRAVTCEYRVFEASGDSGHPAAGEGGFQDARRKIYERYAPRRTVAGLGRVLDRMRGQIAHWYDRDGVSQGELRYQRESHRQLGRKVEAAEARTGSLESERARLLAERDGAQARLSETAAHIAEYERLLAAHQVEIERLNGILDQVYRSKTWRLHLFLDRIRGRR